MASRRMMPSGTSARRTLPNESRPKFSAAPNTSSQMRSAIPSATTATPCSRPTARRFTIAPTIVSTAAASVARSGNSSGSTANVEPAALHMPSASDPDLRPMQTTTYQRSVVRASSMMLSRMPAPTDRAVSNPKLGAYSGNGRSLSIVFGTVAKPIRPTVRSAIRAAPYVVSSPPMQTK